MSPEVQRTTDEPDLAPIASRILVPVANPATAEVLLRLALSLLAPGGKVIATYILLSNEESRLQALDALRPVIQGLYEEGAPVELVTDVASSVARGILDLAQERAADLIVLGVRGLQGNQIVLGPVVDAVARTAPCSVLVYRGLQPLTPGSGYTQVIVPVDGSSNSRLAARIAQRFARPIHTPMTALFVQTEGRVRRSQSMALIEASLTEMEGRDEVRRLVVRANDVVDGILHRVDSACLIVLGFSEEDSLDRWLFGQIPQRLLSGAPGPLLLVKQAVSESVPSRLRHRVSTLLPTLTPAEEAEVVQVAYDLARPTTNFLVLVVLSCLIASLALLMNNVGVVIGAMLIAPLMSPLMAFAVGLIEGRPDLMRTAALTLLRGVVMAFGLAVIIGLLSPLRIPTSEMLARGQPLLPDMGIALFSGMAGAYAMARKDVSSALAGVAIAAALMPPLCTVGLGLAFGLLPLASGAFLLFLTNIVSITLGGGLVFLWLGLRLRARTDRPDRYRWRVVTSVGVLVLLALPLAATFSGSIQQSTRLEALHQVLEAQFEGEVVSVDFQDHTLSTSETLRVVATMHLPEAPTQAALALAQAEAARQLGQPVELELVIWLAVSPATPEAASD